jgi:pyruvate carboxylase
VTGVDLVKAQLRIAAGETIDRIGIRHASRVDPNGFGIELRINMERPCAPTASLCRPPA